jgi:hypothetical protein
MLPARLPPIQSEVHGRRIQGGVWFAVRRPSAFPKRIPPHGEATYRKPQDNRLSNREGNCKRPPSKSTGERCAMLLLTLPDFGGGLTNVAFAELM